MVWKEKKLFRTKNVNFVKSKKWVFSKGVNPWFCSERLKIFSSLFLNKIGLKIMLSWGLEGKDAFRDNKNNNFVKCEK